MKHKSRILLACKHRVRGGGQEKHYAQIARHFQHTYDICFLMTGGYIESDLPDIGKIYHFPGRGRRLLAPFDLIYMGWLILHKRIDIVHAHHRYPAFLGSILKPFLKFHQITTVHNVFPDKSQYSKFGDHAIAVSHGVANWLTQQCGLASEKITVIHNGISKPEEWTSDALSELRRQLRISDHTLVFCAVGRMSEQKNYRMLFSILSKLNHNDWVMLMIGEGELQRQLMEKANILDLGNRIQFLGFRNDVEGIMQMADLFLLTSLWEGLPYVLVESLANGLPAIVTNVGGVAEAISDEETGFVVASGDEDAFLKRISQLISDASLRKSMSIAGKQRFAELFQQDGMFQRISTEYDSLLHLE